MSDSSASQITPTMSVSEVSLVLRRRAARESDTCASIAEVCHDAQEILGGVEAALSYHRLLTSLVKLAFDSAVKNRSRRGAADVNVFTIFVWFKEKEKDNIAYSEARQTIGSEVERIIARNRYTPTNGLYRSAQTCLERSRVLHDKVLASQMEVAGQIVEIPLRSLVNLILSDEAYATFEAMTPEWQEKVRRVMNGLTLMSIAMAITPTHECEAELSTCDIIPLDELDQVLSEYVLTQDRGHATRKRNDLANPDDAAKVQASATGFFRCTIL